MTPMSALCLRAVSLGHQELVLETGRIACQADGSILLRSGHTVLLVTAVAAPEPSAAQGFFPLTVEYREKLAGAGRVPGGFLRREGRAATRETIGARIVDRSIRPLFPPGFRCETQVIATLHSFDPEGDPEVLAITGAATALSISGIPWDGPVAGVRVALREGELQVFPSPAQRSDAELDLVVAVSRQGLVMVEGCAREVGEEEILRALDLAREAALPLLDLQDELRAAIGRPTHSLPQVDEDMPLKEKVAAAVAAGVEGVFAASDKRARHAAIDGLIEAVTREQTASATPDEACAARIAAYAHEALRGEIRRHAASGRRLDGRGATEIRPISGEVGCLPGAHGSSLFTRGETQALVTCTLGTGGDEQLLEEPAGIRHEPFLLHYNFPPYSVGEIRPLRGPGRREIGHGHLAEMALRATLPARDRFPYTIRIESEITSSNGSSSMATVCGATLALMDAGVPLSRPVAGIAMGLITDGGHSAILSDILGDEDHLGDMDFKVAGTAQGVTALQLDNKLGSLSRDILATALAQAREGRLHILAAMHAICPVHREEVPAHAPHVLVRQVRPVRIRDLIGPGGRHIQGIQQDTGVKIDVDDTGRVLIYGAPGARMREAEQRVRHYTGEPQVGRYYRGRVTAVKDFGCFVEIFHGIEGLVPMAQLDHQRVERAADVAAPGEEMIVKVLGTTREGKLELSRKDALGVSASEIES